MIFEEGITKDYTEYTVPMGKVNRLAFLILLPMLVVYLTPYFLLWNLDLLKIGYKIFVKRILYILVFGIISHELLHGITWALMTKGGFKQLKFGINLKHLAPYAHFKKPLKVKSYLLGALMPLLILGIIPAIVGIASGDGFYLLFGLFFTWAATGDIIASIRLFNLPMNSFVQDHPEKLGFIIYHRQLL